MTAFDTKRAYWCDICQVPVIGPICLACGKITREISSSSLRPVFRPEIDYLQTCLNIDLSDVLREMETWVTPSNRVYFVAGRPVLKLFGTKENNQSLSYKLISKNLTQETNRPLEQIHDLLRNANSKYVVELQYEAETFVRETRNKHSSKTLFVSFSGGKDSSVVSHLVMNAFGRSDILHVFADTTIEIPDTYTYIEHFKRLHPLTPVVTCTSSLDFFKIAEDIGPPSRILRWCCTTHKTNPLGKIVGVLNPTAGVLAFDGVRKCESARRTNYQRVSLNHKVGKEVLSSPILEWSDIQLWVYVLYNRIIINTAYESGFRRVGCLYCPFNSIWSEHLIRHYYPEKASFWNSFLYQTAQRIGHADPSTYVDHAWRVRAGGRGLDSYKTIIDSFPCAFSEDAFNYQLLAGSVKEVEIYFRPFGKQIIVHEDEHSKAFMIKHRTSGSILASVELSYDENTLRITFLTKKGRPLLKQRFEKQLRKLQSCVKCGACMAKCPALINPFEDTSWNQSRPCVGCLKCVSFDCPAVDSLTRKGKK